MDFPYENIPVSPSPSLVVKDNDLSSAQSILAYIFECFNILEVDWTDKITEADVIALENMKEFNEDNIRSGLPLLYKCIQTLTSTEELKYISAILLYCILHGIEVERFNYKSLCEYCNHSEFLKACYWIFSSFFDTPEYVLEDMMELLSRKEKEEEVSSLLFNAISYSLYFSSYSDEVFDSVHELTDYRLLPIILKQLMMTHSTQNTYLLMVILWNSLRVYDREQLVATLNEFVPFLIDYCLKKKEKIIRISLLILNQIKSFDDLVDIIIHLDIENVLSQLKERSFKDKDIVVMVQDLLEFFTTYKLNLTNWELYKKEIYTKNIKMSFIHESNFFWKEYNEYFITNNFEILNLIIGYLNDVDFALKKKKILIEDLIKFSSFNQFGKTLLIKKGVKQTLLAIYENSETIDQNEFKQILQNTILHLMQLLMLNGRM
ncbi:hypothetical protein PCE1_003019 [Barthelona sp. PCE]